MTKLLSFSIMDSEKRVISSFRGSLISSGRLVIGFELYSYLSNLKVKSFWKSAE